MTEITSGRTAPDFDMPTPSQGRISSAILRGKAYVIYFYPKADTPGCTTEGQDFSALLPDFHAADTEVIGVSRDPIKALERFADKRSLSVTLASDEDGAVTEAFGVWVEKSMYGKVYMGIERATFLIDGDGVVREVWRKVSVKGHADVVLAAARRLGAGPSS